MSSTSAVRQESGEPARRSDAFSGLTQEQARFWDNNGFLVLERFFSDAEIDSIVALHARLWQELPPEVVVDNLVTGRRARMDTVTEDEKSHPHKVNDLYLNYDEIRLLSLDERLVAVLRALLADTPVLCNTLTLDYGSEQDVHADSLYMTPRRDGNLAATWIALEEGHADAGPLVYYPGSHKIPPYTFSNGRRSEIADEHGVWGQYIQGQISRRGLKLETFVPHKGDVFVWHAQLLHGGGHRANPKLTRRSLVSHYFTAADCHAAGYKLVRCNQAYWMDRPPQACPGEHSGLIWSRLARIARGAPYRLRAIFRGEYSR